MRILFLTLLLNTWLVSMGQVFGETIAIDICVDKTVSLVFPANIVSTDRGTDQVLVQKASENILKVKAATDSSRETSLTVVTIDNKIYSFLVHYAANPAHLTVFIGRNASVKTENRFEAICKKVLHLKSNIRGLKYSSGKVTLQLIGWYVKGSAMFCKLKIENRSVIGYDIEQLRFYIRDNNTLRRTASQEMIQQPLYMEGDTSSISGRTSHYWVIALDKFTIPDDKHFEVEILEKNGGRNLLLKIYNRYLMVAKAF